MAVPVLISLLINALVAVWAFKKGALSGPGILGAMLIGTLILSFGGWVWFALLLTFFLSSSLLSRLHREKKKKVNKNFAKGGPRGWSQTMANGALGVILALLHALKGNPIWLGAYVGVMAAVNADTWATELGVLSKRKPRLITNGAPVPRGTSGAITRAGIFASLGAALLIGLVALLGLSLKGMPWHNNLWLAASAITGGLAGSLFDSYLGATRQAMYYCTSCKEETEQKIHHCGEKTKLLRGSTWLNNDGVNFISSLLGAGLGALGAFFWA